MSSSAAAPADAQAVADRINAGLHQAWAFHQAGRWAEAQSLYLGVLADDAQNFNGLHLLGVLAMQAGYAGEAVAFIGKAIAVHPADASAYSNRGLALRELGRPEEAVVSCGRALALDPAHADACANRGNALGDLGRPAEARASYERAIALKPDHVDAHYNRAGILRGLDRRAAALAGYDHVVAIRPDHADALYNRGVTLHELKRPGEAVASYDRALAARSAFAEAHCGRGNALKDLQRGEEALAGYRRAIALEPDYADALTNRGTVLAELDRRGEALAGYARACAARPGHADAHFNHGLALYEERRLDAALAGYGRALALKPDHADAHYNRGLALQDVKRLAAAVASYGRAIAIRPGYAEANLNKSLALLMAGDFRRGWPLYEWRWRLEPLSAVRRDYPQPLWLGAEPLKGRTILLHSEQGFGDTIQFCRYAAPVAALGARVVMEVRRELLAVLQGLEGVAQFVVQGDALPAFDLHCPLLSLPLALKTEIGGIPGREAYLRSDPARVATWSARLGARTRRRIGIVWSGSVIQRNNRNRRAGLAALLERMPAGCEIVSLQKEVEEADRAVLAANPRVRRFGETVADFADTAALLELMDLVVTVDTSVAHLSGALGRPTWVLVSYEADWRWGLDRDDSPWYASLRLYRQGADRDWTPVLQRVKADLARLAP